MLTLKGSLNKNSSKNSSKGDSLMSVDFAILKFNRCQNFIRKPFHFRSKIPISNQQLDEERLIRNICYQTDTRIAIREAKGKVPVLIGTGHNCTKRTIEKTKKAEDLGADLVLIVTPYYNKPTQEGIYCHFEAIITSL